MLTSVRQCVYSSQVVSGDYRRTALGGNSPQSLGTTGVNVMNAIRSAGLRLSDLQQLWQAGTLGFTTRFLNNPGL